MRKVIFKIDDLEWMRKFYKLSNEQFQELFADKKSLKVIYALIGNGTTADRYELTDWNGNKLRMDDLNGYEKGIVLNDCNAYFRGGKYANDGTEPCGVIEITETEV